MSEAEGRWSLGGADLAAKLAEVSGRPLRTEGMRNILLDEVEVWTRKEQIVGAKSGYETFQPKPSGMVYPEKEAADGGAAAPATTEHP